MSIESNAKIVSVVGGCRRSGRWIVPAETDMVTLFGRAVIDLREAHTTAEQLEFTCLSVFANITFLVPEGAEVRPSGMAILGSSKSIVPTSDVVCALPPMSVDATTIFGRIRIRTTDRDPEDGEKVSFWSRFRREARGSRVPAEHTEVEEGVDLGDTPSRLPQYSHAAESVDKAEPVSFMIIDASGRPQPDAQIAPPIDPARTDATSVREAPRPVPDGTLSDRPEAFGDELEDPPLERTAVDPQASATPLETPATASADLSAPIAPMPDPGASPIEGVEAPDDISEIDGVEAADTASRGTLPARDAAATATDSPNER